LKILDRYPWAGHSAVVGKIKQDWQDTEYVLAYFADTRSKARTAYRSFIEKGISQGRRPDLIGGGLIRSAGGWSQIEELRRAKSYMKGDERILGDGEFVERVLRDADALLDRRYALKAKGYDFETAVKRVADIFGIPPATILRPGKFSFTSRPRSLLCYWANRELRMTTAEVAHKLGICPTAVTKAAQRGETLAAENHYSLTK
jgi:hypothetical protein